MATEKAEIRESLKEKEREDVTRFTTLRSE